jgi:hypothetical protein
VLPEQARGLLCTISWAKGLPGWGVCELGGKDAAQLAEEAGFPEVARMVRESHGETRSPENQSPLPSPQYCETCSAYFEDSNHHTSTAHLLSLSRGPRPPNLPLGVPTSSPGFQLLLRGGWEPGKGLGPRGEGRANPIPTVLKRDQEGLGYRSAPQPRVIHFPARDTRAVSGKERASGRGGSLHYAGGRTEGKRRRPGLGSET